MAGELVDAPAGRFTSGLIATPGGREIEVFGLIKSVMTNVDTGAMQIGLEFKIYQDETSRRSCNSACGSADSRRLS